MNAEQQERGEGGVNLGEAAAAPGAGELMRTQVVYRQGMVKDFICSGELTLSEFMRRASAYGKVRLLRSMRPVRDIRSEAGFAWIGDKA